MKTMNRTNAIPPALTQRLIAYATVAGAATASLPHANAEVVYTPAHNYVDQDFFIDLNHDGINDFHLHSYYLSGSAYLQVFPVIHFNKIVAVHLGCLNGYGAAPLRRGAVIGSSQPFATSGNCMAQKGLTSASIGPWIGVGERYLGLEFYIEGQKHFGWARLQIEQFGFDHTGRILGYAYETIPGKTIIAGDQGHAEEASAESTLLGALALGSSGLDFWRKEKIQ